MSTKSARPVKTKQEELYDKAKNVINDFLDHTGNKTDELKENAEDKTDGLKQDAVNKNTMAAKKTSASKRTIDKKANGVD